MNKHKFALRTAFILTILLMISIQKVEAEVSNPSIRDTKISYQDDVIVYNHEIDILIHDFNDISVEEKYYVRNVQTTPVSMVNIWLDNSNIYNLIVKDEEENELTNSLLNFDNDTSLVTIEFSRSLEKFQIYSFALLYSLGKRCLEIPGNPPYYHFQFTSIYSYNTTNLDINIRFPEECNLHIFPPDITTESYSPDNGNLEVLSGFTWIFWSWSSENLHSMDFPDVSVFMDAPDPQNRAVWIIIVGPVLGTILGASSVYWWMKSKMKKSFEKIGKIFLTDDQKLIIKIIIDNEGKITQKELIELTQFTKSKISRNLFPLEEYGLIRKEKWGREFKVFITESGEKILE